MGNDEGQGYAPTPGLMEEVIRMATNPRNVVSWCLALALALSAQSPGRLTGRVVAEESGLPVAGRAVQAMERKASGAPTILRAVTDANGTYAIDGAPAGTYMLCAPRSGVYLDPCEWGPPITASTGAPSPEMRLRLGIQVTLHVDDPLGLAAMGGLQRPGSAVSVTLTEGGKARVLPLATQGALSYEYSELIPPGRTVQIRVASSTFLLADGAGAPIADGYVFSVVTPAAPGSPVVVQVRIRGKKVL